MKLRTTGSRPFFILNALSPPLKFCRPFYHWSIILLYIRVFFCVCVSFPSYKDIQSLLSLALSSINTVVQKQSSVIICLLLSRWLSIREHCFCLMKCFEMYQTEMNSKHYAVCKEDNLGMILTYFKSKSN